ncbi:armadillo repeat-containing protein 3 isoform X1 [Anabas testudineus]|uniref:armadillo repeat-containing protein 3 isoform X1 n=1 Tax=Anabas testudineus TaxID=64144 RepID=UPI000E45CE0D|nr:armadillo repeat-containing protein 3 isoform X1 [Anabas testudineus]XP_026216972.1 armadillo repeat-containing protein 3 isoform X1 [Anabas testudineus]
MGKKVKKESETPCKETFEALPVVGKTPATVVLLLSSPEEDILIKACEAIHTFAEKGDESKVSLLGLGALEPLCQLITHNNKLVRRNAFMALGIMATNGDVKSALNKIDVTPLIIDKLSLEVHSIWSSTSTQDDTVIHEFATLCLASLSVDFVCKVQIFDNNGLPPLIKLLSSPDPDVKKNSLEIIFNLVQDYQSRLAVHELGGIPPLLELLHSDFPVIQHLTLKTLQNITTDKDTRNAFREQHGFEKLIDILNNTDFSDLHAEALQVVANCLSDSESVQLIHKDGGLTRLMDFLLTPNMPEIQSNAVKCISRVAKSSENRKVLHEHNVEKVLVELLSVADIGVKTSACQAVAAMSFHLSSKDRFRDLGGIPAVVQGLSSESLALRQAATQALSNLTYNNKHSAFAVFEAGGHEILVQQLNGSCPRMVANAAATLGNMARHEIICCSILSHGAIPALVEPLKSTDTQVLVNTTQCLTVLACDTEARAELQRAGGLQPLVSLLQSYHKEVLSNTCFAVHVYACEESAAVEMCKHGALEILQEINQSVNRKSSYSELAMISLLNCNLSVKYSLTGHLASTDVIVDGFYDAGKASAGQRILTLEELFKQPVNQHRPIIVVNTSTENKTEDDTQKDETKCEFPTKKVWKMMDDSLQVLIKEVKESILPLHEHEQYAALARLVSEAMGGPVRMEKLHEFPWVLHLSELKFQLQSNVIPIGLITKGIYYHRALLFKCLADCIGISCTLVRGEYNRAWNEVLLFDGPPARNGCSSQPCRYIVDLMHQPGSLLAADTAAAVQYQTI